MIKRNIEEPISLGLGVDLDWSALLKKSAMKAAYFLVGMLSEEGEVRKSHKEPIIVEWLSDERKADVQIIEDASRRIWGDMIDPALYYDRTIESQE